MVDIFEELFGPGPKPKRVSLKQWNAVVHKMQNSKCMYCGTKLRTGDGHVDHKKPLSSGGKEVPNNMQLLCAPCNTRKGTLTDSEFRRRFKSVLPVTLPPSRPIPLSKFEAVAKSVATKKAKVAKTRRNNDPWAIFS